MTDIDVTGAIITAIALFLCFLVAQTCSTSRAYKNYQREVRRQRHLTLTEKLKRDKRRTE